MDELNNQDISLEEQKPVEEELSHTDKMTGIFTEPNNTFTQMAKFPPRTIDWLLPTILMIVFAILSNLLIMSNPNIKSALMDKQIAQMEKSFQDAVEKGQMTQEQADEQIDVIRDRMDQSGGAFMIIQYVSTAFIIFISFFIVALIYYLISRFALKGNGTYASAMVPVGITYYIAIIQVIIMTILSLAFDRFFAGTSIAAFIDADKTTFAGFLLGKLDIFTIWALAVTSIGLARMFKSLNTVKYYIAVFSVWIIWGFITFGIAKAVPFLSWMAEM